MIFDTWEFGVFVALVVPAYWLVPHRVRIPFLIVADCVFYAAGIPAYLALILGLAAIVFVCARFIERAGPRTLRARVAMFAAVTACVATLATFKYGKLVGAPSPVVPLAISFFTFEFVHFIVDVYDGAIRNVRASDMTAFAMFFPTLVAGPIKRYENFVPQLGRRMRLQPVLVAAGCYRIACGLAKKLILADSLTPLVRPITEGAASFGVLDYWVAMFAYSAKIYFDFSGYSDIAIGTANLLGFQIVENFRRPYAAADIAQFWRRWHISLSSWVRDYLFIPLGGSRRSNVRTLFNLGVVMAMVGLWHGAAWHFALWGLWHGVGLGTHRVWTLTVARRLSMPRALAHPFTFLFVAFGWVLFAAPTTERAAAAYRAMFDFWR